ncbi:MAG: efflux transporter periplasmic adaptor subunit [Pseudomonadota bacterium]
MRFLGRSLMGVFLLSLTVGLLAWAGGTVYAALEERRAQEANQRPARERVLTVNVTEVVAQQIEPILSAFGEISSRRELEVRTAASGTVVFVAPEFVEGGRVTAGQLLLQVDPADAEAALQSAETDVKDAEADLEDAIVSLDLAEDELAAARVQAALRGQALSRQQDLRDRGVGTEAAVEDATLSASTAAQSVLAARKSVAQGDARLAQARTRLDREILDLADAQRRLDETKVVAGFSGTLSETVVAEGGIVSPNERIALLIDPARLEVAFRISTVQFTRLLDTEDSLIAAPVSISLDVLGTDLVTEGRVTRESGSVADGLSGRTLFAALDEAGGFRPGDFVKVSVREPALDRVALLPATAVDASGYVLAVGAEDRLEERETRVLRRQGDNVIVDARGLAGARVLAERTPLTGPGIKVRPILLGEPQEPLEVAVVTLDPERRARLVAFVEGNSRMPAGVKERVLGQLQKDEVPIEMVHRLESRMGG